MNLSYRQLPEHIIHYQENIHTYEQVSTERNVGPEEEKLDPKYDLKIIICLFKALRKSSQFKNYYLVFPQHPQHDLSACHESHTEMWLHRLLLSLDRDC